MKKGEHKYVEGKAQAKFVGQGTGVRGRGGDLKVSAPASGNNPNFRILPKTTTDQVRGVKFYPSHSQFSFVWPVKP